MNKKAEPSQRKHIPMRTCIACRNSRAKRDLVRVVALTGGGVVVDEKGKLNGRGAYLCRQQSCWTAALKHGAVQRALRTPISAEELAALEAYTAQLPESLEQPAGTGAEDVSASDHR